MAGFAETMLAALLALSGTQAGGTEAIERFRFAVEQDRTFGGTAGTLAFFDDAVEFRPDGKDPAERWTYAGLRQVRILSPTSIVLDTYADRGRLRPGDQSLRFVIRTGAVDAAFVAFLLDATERPVVTAVMPPLPSAPEWSVPVHLEARGPDSDGQLEVYAAGVAYRTSGAGHARFWRYRDIFSVLRVDRYRLELQVYEDGASLRRVVFDLQADLPAEMFDAIWQRVNRPASFSRSVQQSPARPRDENRTPEEHQS